MFFLKESCSAGTKLAINQGMAIKYGKEDYVSQRKLMLVFTKLNLLHKAKLVTKAMSA
jgi:hypothetical protein